MEATLAELSKLTQHIRVDPDSKCWVWQRYISRTGYSAIRFKGISYRGHRLMYMLLRGEIPEGLVCDHLCRNRACINPYHLEAVTQRINIIRALGGVEKERNKNNYCFYGHEFTPENSRYIKSKPYRSCWLCYRDARRIYRLKKRLKES